MLGGSLVFVDIDTQRDFLEGSGSLFVPGSESIIPNLARLTRFAVERGIPVLATACCHTPDDPELEQFPPHCMEGTEGQQRIAATDRADSVILAVGARFKNGIVPHLTLHKRAFDVFSRRDAEDVIACYNEARPLFVVYGVATDYCVRAAVEGLVARGCRVAVVVDAVRAIDFAAEADLFTNWARRGVLLVMTDVVCRDGRPMTTAVDPN